MSVLHDDKKVNRSWPAVAALNDKWLICALLLQQAERSRGQRQLLLKQLRLLQQTAFVRYVSLMSLEY
ncbi:MAG: hypothetical protein IPI79_08845 [Moraxellaceae bacterium]|nr:hypothetical protein [Moraxellaceae bacterium]